MLSGGCELPGCASSGSRGAFAPDVQVQEHTDDTPIRTALASLCPDPLHPAPCFLYGWIGDQSIEAIYQAVGQALPTAVPACSGGDICALVWWGTREGTGEPWTDGAPHPIGQGASVHGDGAISL